MTPWKTALANLITHQTVLFKNLTIPMTSTYNPNIIARSLAMTRYLNSNSSLKLYRSTFCELNRHFLNLLQTYSTVIDSNNPISQDPKPLCGQWFINLKNQCQSYKDTLETGYVGLCTEVEVTTTA